MTKQRESAANLRPTTGVTSEIDTGLGGGPVLVVAVGGVDPSGGAGVVRDLLTARTFGAQVRVVPTAWTEQSAEAGVTSVESRDPGRLAQAVGTAWRTAARDRVPAAVKVGMLPDARAAQALLAALGEGSVEGPRASDLGPRTSPFSGEESRVIPEPEVRGPRPEALLEQPPGFFAGPFVFDPVLGASSGGALFRDPPATLLPLVARATLVTPNVPEAAALLGLPASELRTLDDVARAGQALVDAGAQAVLVKGGHLVGGAADRGQAIDTLVTAAGTRLFAAGRRAGPDVRGTGCALATAIAVGLGRGLPLEEAIAAAKAWLRRALERAVARGLEWHID